MPFSLRAYYISHIMRRMKSKKFYSVAKIIGAFVILLALCASGVMFFHTYYYELIYVSGGSMYPTLNKKANSEDAETVGSIVDFGIIDTHSAALKNIKRFDIISTYYPDSTDYNLDTNTLRPGAKKKIKRIIALPNETFKIEKGLLYILRNGEFELEPYSFKTNPDVSTGYTGKDTKIDEPIKLGDNQYWVLGDNRSASRDCATIGQPIMYENIIGVLVAIEGYGKLYAKNYVCDNCGKKFSIKGGNTCSNCQSPLKIEYDINHKQYQWPKFF